jgi:hypothetical protein
VTSEEEAKVLAAGLVPVFRRAVADAIACARAGNAEAGPEAQVFLIEQRVAEAAGASRRKLEQRADLAEFQLGELVALCRKARLEVTHGDCKSPDVACPPCATEKKIRKILKEYKGAVRGG